MGERAKPWPTPMSTLREKEEENEFQT